MQYLSDNFLNEMFKFCLTSKSFLEVAIKHLKFHYLPHESYKRIWKEIVNIYELEQEMPTIGVLNQRIKDDKNKNISKILIDIKKENVSEKKDIIFKSFETYLKEVRFVELYKKTGELFNEEKQDEAIKLMAKESEEISNFSLKDNYFSKVFLSFNERQKERLQKTKLYDVKIPFGIHASDYYTNGGIKKGTSALIMARSGVGKSTALRWVGLNAARLGYKVVHFQIEGTEEETMDLYDAAWTSVDVEDIEFGDISKVKQDLIKKTNDSLISTGGEIYVVASEQFDSMSIEDCEEKLTEIEKAFGEVDLVIFDYLEELTTKGSFLGESGERRRRRVIAKKITNIAVKHRVASLTAIQASDVKPEKWNNPDYVMTRSDISEFKGALQPFSYFLTLNQTMDEYDNGVMRIYNDKFRKHKSGQIYRIYQSPRNSRFYDSKRTLQIFWNENQNCPR